MKNCINIFLSFLYFFVFSYNKVISNDIRSLGIGVNVQDIDTRGYKGLVCRDSKKTITHWKDYKTCSKNADNLYFVSFQYDDRYAVTEEFEGTQVAGHPVLINIGISETSIIEQINVKTDPTAPWYFRKQSYLLWLRIYSKYGSNNWTCNEKEPSSGHLIVGKKYINKICEKVFKEKKVILHTEFYFKNNKKDKENLVSRTNMKIIKYSDI